MIKKFRIKDPTSDAAKLRGGTYNPPDDIDKTIDSIFKDVITNGDDALIGYTEKFDKIKLKSLRISQEDIKHAYSICKCQANSIIKVNEEESCADGKHAPPTSHCQ